MRPALIVLAACGASAPAPAPVPSAARAPSPGLARVPVETGAIEAQHGGRITRVTVTADGGAALSADDLGGVRLWPALDGTVEPRVVDVPAPHALAIAREPGGFGIATTDAVGGLVLQVIAPSGRTLQRVAHPPEPAFIGVVATAHGFLAWRADHTLVRFGEDGTPVEQLALGVGEQLSDVVVGGNVAIAIVSTATSSRARGITLAPHLAWGAWVRVTGGSMGKVAALSPSGRRLATVVGAGTGIRVYALDTGALVESSEATGDVMIAFATEDHLAVAARGTVRWIDLARRKTTVVPGLRSGPDAPGELAAAGGRALLPLRSDLAIVAPDRVQYLGYGMAAPAVAASGPSGEIVIGLGTEFAALDRELRTIAAPAMGVPSGGRAVDLHYLGDEAWLLEHVNEFGQGEPVCTQLPRP